MVLFENRYNAACQHGLADGQHIEFVVQTSQFITEKSQSIILVYCRVNDR